MKSTFSEEELRKKAQPLSDAWERYVKIALCILFGTGLLFASRYLLDAFRQMITSFKQLRHTLAT